MKILYKIYFWTIAAPIFAVLTVLVAVTVIIGCSFISEQFFSYYPGMIWSRVACALTLCPVTVRGRKNIVKGTSYVFVANHQGAYDIFLIYGYLGFPIKWMMKIGLGKIPLVGAACRKAGFIFVDTRSARAAQKSVMEAMGGLQTKSKHSLVVFPEGSRTPDGHLGKFYRGAYQIAVEKGLPIVPITLNGPYKVMPAGSWNIHPNKLEMIIHPPLSIHDDTDNKDLLNQLAETTRKTIHGALWDDFK